MRQDRAIAEVGGFIMGAITALLSGNLPHIDILLNINIGAQILAMMLELVKVGFAGMIGAAGGLAGKKYLFPLVDKYCRKYFINKNKPS